VTSNVSLNATEVPTTTGMPVTTEMPTTTGMPVTTKMPLTTEIPTKTENTTEMSYMCSDDLWHFLSCPACQCNGHSTCSNESVCSNCSGNTEGSHCERCAKHYSGDPRNGGECKPCFCNGHGDECNHRTGECYCKARGLKGIHCEKCSDSHYLGSGENGSFCHYHLVSGYQYTFNLTLDYLNSSQFYSEPKKESDFYFFFKNLTVYTTNVSVSLTYAENGDPNSSDSIKNWTNPKDIQYILDEDEYDLNRKSLKFFVNVQGFRPPFLFTIGFSSPPEDLNLLEFFITFFGFCRTHDRCVMNCWSFVMLFFTAVSLLCY
jgi:hypothetical protein